MKSVIFNEKDKEKFKKSDKMKYIISVLATPVGLLLSCVLAYLNIDFIELLNIFSENISNSEVLDELAQIMRKWYIISGVIFLAASLLLGIYYVRNRKNDEEESFTWGQTIFFTIELILISQVVLPLLTITIEIVIALFYFVFFSSVLLKMIALKREDFPTFGRPTMAMDGSAERTSESVSLSAETMGLPSSSSVIRPASAAERSASSS